MNDANSKVHLARKLIELERYNEARLILQQVDADNTDARRWLDHIERIAPSVHFCAAQGHLRDFEVHQIRKELQNSNERLSLLNQAIQQAARGQQPSDALMMLGFFLLPFFGLGALVLLVAYQRTHHYRSSLTLLQQKRRHLLDDIETKYRMLNTLRRA